MSDSARLERTDNTVDAQPLRDARLQAWSLIVAANDDEVLCRTLLASPAIDHRCQVITLRGYRSAAAAYNTGIQKARHEILVFAHQDVYLPEGWTANVERALAFLDTEDPHWGVLGIFGVADAGHATLRGHCYSTGLRTILGAAFSAPQRASSLDEFLLVVRRSRGLRFDENLPGFHLYGTDICLEARSRGLNAYIIPAFCIHNSMGLKYFPIAFWRAYLYIRTKWPDQLPIVTCCTTVTKYCGPMLTQLTRDVKARLLSSRRPGIRSMEIDQLYRAVIGSVNEQLDDAERASRPTT